MKKNPAMVCCLLFFLCSAVFFAGHASGGQSGGYPGTYSTLVFDRQSGDVLGEELRIMVGKNGYKGTLQFSEGWPGDPVLLDIRIEGTSISFDTPETWEYAGHFSGEISAREIHGTLTLKNGNAVPLNLPRRTSYWDKPVNR